MPVEWVSGWRVGKWDGGLVWVSWEDEPTRSQHDPPPPPPPTIPSSVCMCAFASRHISQQPPVAIYSSLPWWWAMVWKRCPYFQHVNIHWYNRLTDKNCLLPKPQRQQQTYIVPLTPGHTLPMYDSTLETEVRTAGLLIIFSNTHDDPLRFYSTIAVVVWCEIDARFF